MNRFPTFTRWFKKSLSVLLLVIFCYLLFPEEAQAFYIDPGTGSLIIQVLLGFLVGGLVALKIFWASISARLRKFFGRPDKDEKS